MKKIIAMLLSVFLLSCFVGNLTFAANPSIDSYYYDSNADKSEPTYFILVFGDGTYIWRVLEKNTGTYYNVVGEKCDAIKVSMELNGYATEDYNWWWINNVDIYDKSEPPVTDFNYFRFIFSDGTYIWRVLEKDTGIYHNVAGDEGLAAFVSMHYNRYAVKGSDRYDSYETLKRSIENDIMLKHGHSF